MFLEIIYDPSFPKKKVAPLFFLSFSPFLFIKLSLSEPSANLGLLKSPIIIIQASNRLMWSPHYWIKQLDNSTGDFVHGYSFPWEHKQSQRSVSQSQAHVHSMLWCYMYIYMANSMDYYIPYIEEYVYVSYLTMLWHQPWMEIQLTICTGEQF